MRDIIRDIRRSLRRLRRAPIFTIVSILTLAIGISVFTSVYSLMEGVLLEKMPYRNSEQLAWVWRDYSWADFPRGWLGGPDISGLREQSDVFDGVVVVRTGSINLSRTEMDSPSRTQAMFTSPELFDVLGVSPMLGRGFVAGEDDPDADPVVVLSFDLWRTEFNADSAVLGETISLSGVSATVVGVAPPNFRFMKHGSLSDPVGADLYSNLRLDVSTSSPGNGAFAGLVRIRPGVQPQQLEQALARAAQTSDLFFDSQGLKLWTVGLQEDLTESVRPALLALIASAGFLLLILGANLTTLFLSRGSVRTQELAICAAIGASRKRLLSSVAGESLVVGIAGGVLGTALAFLMTDLMVAMAPDTVPRLHEVGIDLSVMLVAVGMTGAITLITGLAPAIRAIRQSQIASLREGGRSGDSVSGAKTRNILVIAQVALCLMLLVGAGLVGQAFGKLVQQDPGFDPGETLTFTVPLTFSRYGDSEAILAQHNRIREAFAAIPGVTSVGATTALPLTQLTNQTSANFPSAPGNVGGPQDTLLVDYFSVAGDLSALGFRVLAGRAFTDEDQTRTVAIIDDVLSRRFFANTSPIGYDIVFAGDTFNVIGVVDHARLYNVFQDDRGQVYTTDGNLPSSVLSYALRSDVDPIGLAAAARNALHALDPTAPVAEVRTLSSIVSDSLGQQRLSLSLLGAFAGGALILAVLGIYGVVTNNVVRRYQEIGLRMALGAPESRVLRMILGQGLRLTLIGGGIGLVGAIAASRLLDSVMFGIDRTNPLIYAGVTVLLLGVATAASYLPARSATRIDPVKSLRP